MLSDEELFLTFQQGDSQAFETLVLRHKDGLIFFISRYVHNIALAEELAQDAFVDVFLQAERTKLRTTFKTWIYTIGRNKSADWLRKNSRLIPMPEELPEPEENELERRVIQQENKQLVGKCLRMLSSSYQTVIQLIDFEGMTYLQAAQVLHKSLPQVKVTLFRARKALRAALEREGYCHEE